MVETGRDIRHIWLVVTFNAVYCTFFASLSGVCVCDVFRHKPPHAKLVYFLGFLWWRCRNYIEEVHEIVQVQWKSQQNQKIHFTVIQILNKSTEMRLPFNVNNGLINSTTTTRAKQTNSSLAMCKRSKLAHRLDLQCNERSKHMGCLWRSDHVSTSNFSTLIYYC